MSSATSEFWVRRHHKSWVLGCVAACFLYGVPAGAASPSTKPGVPTITSVKAGPQSAIVSFDNPMQDGGAPVRSDEVTCRSSNGGVTGIQNGAASPISVRALSVGKKYTCRVAARNTAGLSGASAPSGVVIPLPSRLPAVPGAPTVTYVHAGPQSIAVGFAPPASRGGAIITTYRAECSSSNGGHPGAKQNLRSPVVLDRLTAGKAYTCTVKAGNRGGLGPASSPSDAVTTLALPKVTSVKGGVRSLTVVFTMPGKLGPPLVVSYQATCTSTDGGATGSQSAAASPIRVRGLSVGKTYRCRVTVKNGSGAAGTSAPSAPAKTNA